MPRSAWLEQRLLRAWTRRGPLAWGLWPLSRVYGALVTRRRRQFQSGQQPSTRLPVPVIVVGNIVAGGGGKTPAVIAIVQHLRARGLHPGVLSRGYGREGDDCREVLPDSVPAEVGDEPLLIRRTCAVPVFVARLRAQAGRALLARHPEIDVLVCDDGLQHYALARDIEICVFDDRGIGNGWLLPAGPLREAWPRPVDLVLHTAQRALAEGFGSQRRLAERARRADGTEVPLASLRGQPVVALAGIARPAAFFDMLRASGLTLAQALALPDHFDFGAGAPALAADQTLLCTEKDAVKLWQHVPQALAVPLIFIPEPAFLAALDRLLDPLLQGGPVPKLSSPHGHQTT